MYLFDAPTGAHDPSPKSHELSLSEPWFLGPEPWAQALTNRDISICNFMYVSVGTSFGTGNACFGAIFFSMLSGADIDTEDYQY